MAGNGSGGQRPSAQEQRISAFMATTTSLKPLGEYHQPVSTPGQTRLKAQQAVAFDSMCRRDDITRHDILHNVIRKRARDARGCMSLPMTITFFILYAFSMRLHEDITNVFLLESAVRHSMTKDLDDVGTIGEMWAWLKGPFASQLFVQEDLYGEPLPLPERSRVLQYSQVQGAVVLTQWRSSAEPWGANVTAAGADPYTMALQASEDPYTLALQASEEGFIPNSELGSEGRRLSILRPELASSLPGEVDDDATYEFRLYPTMNFTEILQRLDYLERRGWLDEETNGLSITALLLNAELGRPRIEQLLLKFSFNPGGGIYWKISLESLFLKPFPMYISILSDALWLSMLIGSTAWMIRKASQAAWRGELHNHLTHFPMVIEWMIIIGGWLNVLAFVFVYFVLMGEVSAALRGVIDAVSPLTSAGEEGEGVAQSNFSDSSAKLHDTVAVTVTVVAGYLRISVAWYNLLLMFRFFISFRAQPRLAVVVNTLKAAAVDMLHFLVVFFPTFVAYVVSGNLLFGRRLQEFSTMQASAGTCFRIVIENEFEWEQLSEEHFSTAAVWVWSFLVVVVLIMLNMVLAIMLDVYNEVRQRVDSADSVFLFLSQTVRRLWKSREWIGEHVLVNLLSEMDGTTTITKADIQEMIPEITKAQLDMLFQACKDNMKFRLKQEMDRATFMKVAAGIKMNVDQINEQVHQATKQEILKDGGQDGSEAQDEKGEGEAEEQESPEGRGRMLGTSRPFPGMPPTPGGFCPPLLAPEDASNEVFDATGRPAWLAQLDHSMDLQEAWMTSLQAQLQELQWKWKMTQRVGGSAAREAAKEALQEMARQEDASFEDASAEYNRCGSLLSRGGATIL